MSNSPLIYPAMNKVMAAIGAISKDQVNQQQRFNFRGIDQVYNALQKHMVEAGIFTTSEILHVDYSERVTPKGGVLLYTRAQIKYQFHASDGSSVASTVIGEGMDSGDKASNKAMAIAHKYALLQAFMVPTEEQKDPESDSHDLSVEYISSDQVAELDSLIKDVGANKEKYLTWLKVASLERIPAKAYRVAKEALERKAA